MDTNCRADTVHGRSRNSSNRIKLTFDIFEQEQSWILLSLEGVIREGRRQRAVGTAEKCDDESQCVCVCVWSEQTRRAGHGWVGGPVGEEKSEG